MPCSTFPRASLMVLALAGLAACSQQAPPQADKKVSTAAPAAAVPVTGTDGSSPAAAGTEEARHLPLAGTSWRLVQIMSMDDTTYTPDEPDRYRLAFSEDRVSIVADCNRGTGAWTASGGGQLQFGVIAATQAVCPPESLHDRYMAQFQWVRSYVTDRGHLFLATMADGSIIEFEPAPPLD